MEIAIRCARERASLGEISSALEEIYGRHKATIRSISGVYSAESMNDKGFETAQELVRKFVLASSNEGDLVIDPFSGSGTTAVVAEQLNRHWMACDLDPQYNQWAIERLESVRRMTKDEWIAHDRKTAERRESIR